MGSSKSINVSIGLQEFQLLHTREFAGNKNASIFNIPRFMLIASHSIIESIGCEYCCRGWNFGVQIPTAEFEFQIFNV